MDNTAVTVKGRVTSGVDKFIQAQSQPNPTFAELQFLREGHADVKAFCHLGDAKNPFANCQFFGSTAMFLLKRVAETPSH